MGIRKVAVAFMLFMTSFGAFAEMSPSMAVADMKGVNMPGWGELMSQPYFFEKELPFLRSAGLNHIRIPVSEHCVFDQQPSNDCSIERLKSFLAALDKNGFSATVDFHPTHDFFQEDSATWHAQFRQAWAVLGERLRNTDTHKVAFELLNEPQTTMSDWKGVIAGVVADLRSRDRQRTIILGVPKFYTPHDLMSQTAIDDPNVVYAVHFYTPMIFTHQGATWIPGSYYPAVGNVQFPVEFNTPEQKALCSNASDQAVAACKAYEDAAKEGMDEEKITKKFGDLQFWAKNQHTRVVINEFGALRYRAPIESRAAYLAAVRKAAEAKHMGWVVWDYSQGFGITEKSACGRRPVTPLFSALGLDTHGTKTYPMSCNLQ
ncbi:glycoside hydrolase family 5 protein [Paraburkholderia antibiotica]|uniref:Glycoside hydrolase family 5 protein n=1 Tax=Paraburkholderia antibiotica TaxID=2728839 RepID=A0A7Y0A0M3_9BURK|nr:cellulase family glycosylhydrolase [Paraburkholderia antibiotica]NML34328.1 glycoside hydrolase family 5 protein [Paraburkholderia antibiotica]